MRQREEIVVSNIFLKDGIQRLITIRNIMNVRVRREEDKIKKI